ncbi:MAG: hypothetical protein ABL921_27080 [Pirellula sp.]
MPIYIPSNWDNCSTLIEVIYVFAVGVDAIGGAEGETTEWTLDVAGSPRTARVYLPKDAIRLASANLPNAGSAGGDSSTSKLPVVFGFHGHGGNSRNAQRSFQIERHWPEAIVVYMQGLPTPGQLTDPEGKKNGWQKEVGDQNDRDLKFFDALLAKLETEFAIDKERIYSTGHSNGGGFTYLLWSARSDRFAAFAPCASAAGRRIPQSPSPKPVLHIAGTNDPLVKFAWQEATIQRLVTSNACEQQAVKDAKVLWSVYPSPKAPVFTFVHDGTHKYPDAAPAMIAQFFKTEPWKTMQDK